MNGDSITLGYLAAMFGVVLVGSVVPVLPTGAAVSVAAALAGPERPLVLAVVLVLGAAGAWLGDVTTYAGLRVAGDTLQRRVRWLRSDAPAGTLHGLRERVEEHDVRVLMLSRLVPAGRLPVLVAAALGGFPWARFAVADLAGAALWSAFYAVIGIAGSALFPHPWEGVAATVVLVVVVSLASSWWQRRRAASAGGEPETG